MSKSMLDGAEDELFTLRVTGAQPDVRNDPDKDWIANMQGELDAYYVLMKQFNLMDTAEVLQQLSSWSARASEMRTQLVRVESRKSNAFRTREVDPFLDECDRQFKIHSRLQSLRELDWKMASGQGF